MTIASNAHRRGVMQFEDLHYERGYDGSAAYAQSKLANLLFTYELQARLAAAGAGTIALAAHPGTASTGLWRSSSRLERLLISPRLRALNFWLAQTPESAALPMLRAAVDPAALGGGYYGPSGPFQYTGSPEKVQSSPGSQMRRRGRDCGSSPNGSPACRTPCTDGTSKAGPLPPR